MPEDMVLKCKDCDSDFVWTIGEQEYFATKRLSQPKRCPPCRKRNRERKEREGGGHRHRR